MQALLPGVSVRRLALPQACGANPDNKNVSLVGCPDAVVVRKAGANATSIAHRDQEMGTLAETSAEFGGFVN